MASASSTVCSVSGTNGTTLTFAAAGSCVVNANQAGSATHSAAPQESTTIAVTAGFTAQTITWTSPPTAGTVGTPLTLTASASGGGTVVFTSASSSVCSVSGTTLTLSAAGSCVVNANQAGSTTFAAAPQVSTTVTVSKAVRTISWTWAEENTSKALSSTPLTLAATSTGGGTVVFTVATASASSCRVSGNALTLTQYGACVVYANQRATALTLQRLRWRKPLTCWTHVVALRRLPPPLLRRLLRRLLRVMVINL